MMAVVDYAVFCRTTRALRDLGLVKGQELAVLSAEELPKNLIVWSFTSKTIYNIHRVPFIGSPRSIPNLCNFRLVTPSKIPNEIGKSFPYRAAVARLWECRAAAVWGRPVKPFFECKKRVCYGRRTCVLCLKPIEILEMYYDTGNRNRLAHVFCGDLERKLVLGSQ